ncbi:diguanylate cyclase (GGDEF) domain protein [Leptospira inadai serovar Lyme str. 10]|uniref:diguanylate cyclase n=2 Tax=Leptospira inadai serovar Lyme TaxID=293084 RepID=V6HF07_9LEPT|nr:GGDEF domain-containing protein [Leptospira inadai]EQA38063.1 diguanylate cyclase (GGDEF) domain protein [Leptospira inadai serovar Lyme str. 10]PNV73033.1 GGDEF domain-containing protein [Leptospira inadai serovar Lyme]
MVQWFPGSDLRARHLFKRILFNDYPSEFIESNLTDIRQSLAIHYSFCILITFFTFLIPDSRTVSGEPLFLLYSSRITLVLLSLLFLWRNSLKTDWNPKNMESYKVWSSSVLLVSFLPFLYLDEVHYDIYLHQATAILLSMNILLWLTTTTVVLVNLTFGIAFFGICYLSDSISNAFQEFPILLTYIFVGTFGNIIMNYWRMMDYRDKSKLSRAVIRLRKKNDQIRRISSVDDLTGLYNRRYLIEQFDIFKKRARRYKFNMALIILDMDHLKETNDKFGHMAGDEALQTLSAVMKSRVRATDVCARIGGDEFCILLDSVDPEGLEMLCESLRKGVAAQGLSIEDEHGTPVFITISIGASILPFDEDLTFDDLYQSIDSALYKSKSAGRNKVTIVTASKQDKQRDAFTSWPTEVRIYK